VVVIGGIRNEGANAEILVDDSWPVDQGDLSWRSIDALTGILADGSNSNRNTFILCYED